MNFRTLLLTALLPLLGCKKDVPAPAPAPAPTEAKAAPSPPIDAGAAPAKAGPVPTEVADQVQKVLAAVEAERWADVRPLFADEFYWNLGDEPSADEAVKQLGKNAHLRSELVRVLRAGCAKDATGDAVLCPPEAVKDDYADYRARFDKNAGWKMTSFVGGD